MNNDLINRSALKKAIETYDKFACLPDCKLETFRNLEHPEMFEPYVHLRDILNAIDNAPTVEIDKLILIVAKRSGKRELMLNALRPHGEWLAKEDMDFLDENKVWHFHFMCEKCGFIHDFLDGHTSQYEYCPNCGAKMKEIDNE